MKYNQRLLEGSFGLERETLRVDAQGSLAQTPHPFDDDRLTRDFCENQLEIVTPVCSSIPEMTAALARLDRQARSSLAQQNETLWVYSNPPHFDTENEIPIARFEGPLSGKHDYRVNLERRYGKRLMLYSGIHFNFSFSEGLLAALYAESGKNGTFAAFRTALYFRLMKQISRYSWLPLLLTAASPVYDASFDADGASGIRFDGDASMRSGERGYWNQFVPELDYSDLPSYIASVACYIRRGVLFSASELYLPVRMKPPGENSLDALAEKGIDHIELRMFDLNPLAPLGFAQADAEFACMLLCWLLTLPDFDFTPEMQAEAIANHKAAARYDLSGITIWDVPIRKAAERVFCEMAAFYAANSRAQQVIAMQRQKLTGRRYCEIIAEQAAQNSPYHIDKE